MDNPVAKRTVRSALHPRNILLMLSSVGSFGAAVAALAAGIAAWPVALVGGFAALCGWGISMVSEIFRADSDYVKGDTRVGFNPRERRQKLREVEEQLDEVVKAAQTRRLKISPDFVQRRTQLRRLMELEHQITTNLTQTEGTISVLPNDIQGEVGQFVDRAIDLSFLRTSMLRAFVRTNEAALREELRTIEGRVARTTGPAKADIELLFHAKEEQLEAFRRLRNDLVGTEAQLDAIEAFLQTITYGQSLTVGSVRQEMTRLKTKIEARRQSAEEVQRLVNGLDR
jgi:hypothetical protein